MTESVTYLVAIAGTFLVNVPFGYWRAGVRKFSPAWFVAIHAAVPRWSASGSCWACRSGG